MPVNWVLACYSCGVGSCNSWTGPTPVAHWTFEATRTTVGLCGTCLNLWLDNVDSGAVDEPARLEFLIAPAELMALAA